MHEKAVEKTGDCDVQREHVDVGRIKLTRIFASRHVEENLNRVNKKHREGEARKNSKAMVQAGQVVQMRVEPAKVEHPNQACHHEWLVKYTEK